MMILLLQKLCNMGKNTQLPMCMVLFKLLINYSIVHTIQWMLTHSGGKPKRWQMITVSGLVLTTLLDHNVNGV